MTFEWPYLLLSLLMLPLLFGLYVLAQRRRRAYAVRFTNVALLRDVMGRGPGIRRHIPPMLYLLGLVALLTSLARPIAVVAVPRDQSAVMLVMDVSGSMQADDLRPDRMAAARQAAHAFVDALPDNLRAGLVSFNQSAMVEAPLTRDHDQIKNAIDTLEADGGTAIGEGLDLALDVLERREIGNDEQAAPAFVVLLSDGMSTHGQPPITASQRAKSVDIKVYTVGIGQRGATPMVNGRLPVRLDEATLQSIAQETGGAYFYAAESNTLTEIYAELGSQVSWVEERTEVTALVSALGTILMLVGGLLSLRWFQQLP
jgi:Ca-activated chloride channel family protein